jgi:hypothetical protein
MILYYCKEKKLNKQAWINVLQENKKRLILKTDKMC